MENVNSNRIKSEENAVGTISNQDPLTIEGTNVVSQSPCVFVTIPQNSIATSKGQVQSVIQQPQQSVIQSTPLQTVQISKGGNVYLLKQPVNSVIQSPGGNNLQTVQVISAESLEEHVEPSRKRQLLARRPSYKKILNDLSGVDSPDKVDQGSSDSSQEDNSAVGTITVAGTQYQPGLLKVIPASSLQLGTGHGDVLQPITMTNTASAGGTIVHYAPGSSDGQIIVPELLHLQGRNVQSLSDYQASSVIPEWETARVAASDLSSLKIATSMGNVGQSVVLATSSSSHQGDTMVEEASRKREIRLMKNREAARECRAKKKEYIKCLENRVAVLENQNKTLVEELQTLKNLYKLSDVKASNLI